jgi:hypothetical protein
VPLAATGAVLMGLLASGPQASPVRRVPVGEWGGPHARLDVQVEGARLELDCAHGTIDGAMVLGRGGRFRAKGRLQREAGPAMAEDEAEGRPAEFTGMLKGSVLTLTILTEDRLELGPFKLELGARAELVKCQ